MNFNIPAIIQRKLPWLHEVLYTQPERMRWEPVISFAATEAAGLRQEEKARRMAGRIQRQMSMEETPCTAEHGPVVEHQILLSNLKPAA